MLRFDECLPGKVCLDADDARKLLLYLEQTARWLSDFELLCGDKDKDNA